MDLAATSIVAGFLPKDSKLVIDLLRYLASWLILMRHLIDSSGVFSFASCQGIRAFLWLLRWPVLLRTLLISQFIIWIVVWGFVVGSWLLVFSFHILSVACLYVGAYCIVKRAGGTQSGKDILHVTAF